MGCVCRTDDHENDCGYDPSPTRRRRARLLAMAKQPSDRDREVAARISTGFPKTALTGVMAYCVLDKEKVEMQHPEIIAMRNGQPAVKGVCPKCGSLVFKVGLPNAP